MTRTQPFALRWQSLPLAGQGLLAGLGPLLLMFLVGSIGLALAGPSLSRPATAFLTLEVATLLFVGASLWLFLRGTSRRLHQLEENAITFSAEQPAVHVVTGRDEIARLSGRFSEALARTQEQKERLNLALERARIEFVEIEPVRGEVTLLGGGQTLGARGLTDRPWPTTISGWMALIHQDDRGRVREALASLAAGQQRAIEFRVGRDEGGFRWLELIGLGARGGFDPDSVLISGVLTDLTDRKRSEADLRSAVENARQASAAKSEFLARMSHELRTPLNAVLGFAQLLEMDELTADQAENVAHISRGGRLLLSIINEVLDLARIEAGKIGLSIEPLQTRTLIEDTTALMEPAAVAGKVRLLLETLDESCVLADRQRLRQVLMNLVSNAIKYNRPGGYVRLSVGTEGERVRFRVKDTGMGISPDRMPNLFQPFERLGADHSGVEGTGLGLAVSKNLVSAMGGVIEVESSPGEGSTFSVLLPTAPRAGARQGTIEFPTPRERGRDSRVKAVYVEDNPANLDLMRAIAAKSRGVELIAISDGRSALEAMKAEKPDLVILDLNLPDVAGDVILRSIVADPVTRHVPVVILSADATQGEIDRLLLMGAHSYLTKPVSVQTMMNLFAECAALKKEEGRLT